MSGHLGIRQRTVVSATDREAGVGDQGPEFVVRGFRKDPTGDQHRAYECIRGAVTDALEFCRPEFPIERRIVGHKWVVTDEIRHLGHDLGDGRCCSNHAVGDSGQALNKSGNPLACIHQALVPIDNLAVTHQHGGDFRGSRTVIR